MNVLQGIVLLGALWTLPSVHCLDCLQSAVLSRAEECFGHVIPDWNFTQLLNLSYTQLLSVISENPTLMCSDFESKKSAFLCLANATVSCMEKGDPSGAIFPTPIELWTVWNISVITHKVNVDSQCIEETQEADYRCIESRTAVSNSTFTSLQSHICEVFEVFRDCRSETLAACANQTRDVYVTYIEDYVTPPECRAGGQGNVQTGTDAKQGDCSPGVTGQQTEECYDQLSQTLGVSVSQVLDIVLADPAVLCQHLKAFKKATHCAETISRKCFSTGQHSDIQPDWDVLSSAMNNMCAHLQDVDAECIKQRHSADLKTCVNLKARAAGMQPSFDDFLSPRFLCWSIETTLDCLREVTAQCAGQTKDIYLQFAHDYLTLPICQNLTMDGDIPTIRVGSNIANQPGHATHTATESPAGEATHTGTESPTGEATQNGLSPVLLASLLLSLLRV